MYDVIVVGGGAAGLTAALYTARQGMSTLVLTKDIGGQAILTPSIENYPGFESISGLEFAERVKEQAERFNAEFRYEEVKGIEAAESYYLVRSTMDEYETISVILAFGKTPRDLNVPGEAKLVGKGVSYCAVCDAPLYKGKRVAVVGIGDPALDATLMLCSIAERVYLISRSSALIGHEDLMGSCSNARNVELLLRANVLEIVGDNRVKGIRVKDAQGIKDIEVDGVFIELGYIARTEWLKGLVELNEKGEIVVNKNQETSRAGIFAAGDVTDTQFKQLVISAGEGAKAGLAAYNYVQRLKGKPVVRSDWKTLLSSK
ncbi:MULTISPECIES: NAD(P)/FAD-dependent oxidoreductase [Candidatus Nitrosocaldus]|jgi:thioredoxin reductase (NADPH)|uniref:Thioredoxin-disulfide reductase (TrxB) n=1 Tax=Candidatus Nitrosocaldus cavascurensis TaxID=2058097 RepID=A0A2K5ANS2_9ARCH|nr:MULTISPECIES: FAD-dependent oxidoreductase [Candidatus Nitrosocaldus]SPC33282.1 Thioredoxin-disulfide reductase (TrxB) [Candidatus Nitrosocaldus cavascurensis]